VFKHFELCGYFRALHWLFVGVVLWSLTAALESVFLSSSMPTARKGDLSNQERRACSGTFGNDGDDFLDTVDVDDGLVDSGSSTPRFHCLWGMARDNGPGDHRPSAKSHSRESEYASPQPFRCSHLSSLCFQVS
jgi:hypothetical protein